MDRNILKNRTALPQETSRRHVFPFFGVRRDPQKRHGAYQATGMLYINSPSSRQSIFRPIPQTTTSTGVTARTRPDFTSPVNILARVTAALFKAEQLSILKKVIDHAKTHFHICHAFTKSLRNATPGGLRRRLIRNQARLFFSIGIYHHTHRRSWYFDKSFLHEMQEISCRQVYYGGGDLRIL